MQDFDGQTILFRIWGEMQSGFGELREGQRQNRIASEQRAQELHARINRVESHLEERMDRRASSTGPWKLIAMIAPHWQIIVAAIMIAGGLMMGKSPDVIKGWLASLKLF